MLKAHARHQASRAPKAAPPPKVSQKYFQTSIGDVYSILMKELRPVSTDLLMTNHQSNTIAYSYTHLSVNPLPCGVNTLNLVPLTPNKLRDDRGPKNTHFGVRRPQLSEISTNIQNQSLAALLCLVITSQMYNQDIWGLHAECRRSA